MIFGRKPLARATHYCTCAKQSVKAEAGLLAYNTGRKGQAISSREKRRVVGEGRSLGALPGKHPRIGGLHSGVGRKLSGKDSGPVLNPQNKVIMITS